MFWQSDKPDHGLVGESAVNGVRAARMTDAGDIARIEVETWRETYAGMLPDRVLLGLSVERQAHLWAQVLRRHPGGIWVCEEAATGLVGFGQCGPQRNQSLAYDGEIHMLYVHPDAQNRGVGRNLLLALFDVLVAAGQRSALVWVLRANPARHFYARLGATLVLHRRIPVGGEDIDALGYGWPDLCAARSRCGGR